MLQKRPLASGKTSVNLRQRKQPC